MVQCDKKKIWLSELLDELNAGSEVQISGGDRLAVALDIDDNVEFVYFALP